MTASGLDRFYDLDPVALVMLGGPHDGRVIYAEGEPFGYNFAVPPELPLCALLGEVPPRWQWETDYYYPTGRIRDDGARVYQYGGRG